MLALKQALGAFDFVGTQLIECDYEIEQQVQLLQTHEGEPTKGKRRGRARNAPKFDLRTQLFKMCGVDLTRIDGIDSTTALAVISETGADMSRFPTVGHFASWLGLYPGTKITGSKVMSGKNQAMRQLCRPSTEAGRSGSTHQPAGTGRVLQTHVLAHG